MRSSAARWVLLGLVALAGAAPAAEAARRPLTLGFYDDAAFASDAAATRATWLDRAVGDRAGIVRMELNWARVAPTAPDNGSDPTDPAYDWSSIDAPVADAQARGLRVLLTLSRAPRWAEGPRRPRSAPAGSWKPNVAAFRAFAKAAAKHFDGTAPNVPAVRHWQVWNEPNLTTYLSPQWRRLKGGRYRVYAPSHYRDLLNAAYGILKRVNPENLVVTAGTGPYGDPNAGGNRIMPVAFWRKVFRARTRFDALSHHPYAIASPRRRALNRNDVAIADVHKLVSVTRAAVRRGMVLPAGRKRFWATEISWDSKPPDPRGVPEARRARWLAEAFYSLWKQGVDTITWLAIRDSAPRPSFAESYQSGTYLRDGSPKLARRAFAFPVACERVRGAIRVWGKSPAAGQVVVKSRGKPVGTARAGATRVFLARIPTSSRGIQVQSGQTESLTCRPF